MGAAVGAAIVAIFTSTAVWAVVVRTVLINVVLGYLTKALSDSPKQYVPPVNVTVRNATENRRLAFGKIRCGGTVVFYRAAGANNDFLHYLVVYTGHQVQSIDTLWFDNQAVTSSQIGGGGAVTAGPFAANMWIWKYLGTSSQAADSDMVSAFGPIWTSSHQLKGCAYVHIKMQRSDVAYPQGAPQNVTALISGARLYDPRLDTTNGGSGTHRAADPSTWAYSANPALALRWFITGGSVHNDVTSRLIMYGMRESDSRLADAYTIAAANRCDENITGASSTPDGDQLRYTLGLECSTGEPRRQILEAMLATMAGAAVYVKGTWRIYAGGSDTPAVTFTDANIFGDIEVNDTTEHTQRYNAVACVFRDSLNSYIEQTTIHRLNSSYETQDNSERIPTEIDLRGCTDRYRAQRLCEIYMRKSRAMRTISFRGDLTLLDLAPNETFDLTFAPLGWTNYLFRCVEREFSFSDNFGWVKITAQIEYASIWTDLVTAAYDTPNTVTPIISVEIPSPPGSPSTVPQVDAILVKWAASSTPGVLYSLEQSTSSSMSSPTVAYTGADSQAYIDKTATTIFYFRVRAVKFGVFSDYAPTTGGVSGAALGVSTALTGTASPSSGTSTGTGASQTTNSVTVTASGGTPGYTYAWTNVSSSGTIAVDSAAAATTTFSAASLGLGETRTATKRCTITDSVAATKTIDVTVSITRINSFTASAVGTAPLYKSANASAMTSANITATPSGGTPAYTYLWSIVSHDDPNSTPTINNSTTSVCTVTTNEAPANQLTITVTVKCVVTDSLSNTATTNNVTISHVHDNGL
jgi:hypothetical protein